MTEEGKAEAGEVVEQPFVHVTYSDGDNREWSLWRRHNAGIDDSPERARWLMYPVPTALMAKFGFVPAASLTAAEAELRDLKSALRKTTQSVVEPFEMPDSPEEQLKMLDLECTCEWERAEKAQAALEVALREKRELEKELSDVCDVLYNTGATRGDALTRARRAVASYHEHINEQVELEERLASERAGRELGNRAAKLLRDHVAGENVDDLMHYWADDWDARGATPAPPSEAQGGKGETGWWKVDPWSLLNELPAKLTNSVNQRETIRQVLAALSDLPDTVRRDLIAALRSQPTTGEDDCSCGGGLGLSPNLHAESCEVYDDGSPVVTAAEGEPAKRLLEPHVDFGVSNYSHLARHGTPQPEPAPAAEESFCEGLLAGFRGEPPPASPPVANEVRLGVVLVRCAADGQLRYLPRNSMQPGDIEQPASLPARIQLREPTASKMPPGGIPLLDQQPASDAGGEKRLDHSLAWSMALKLKDTEHFEILNRYIAQSEATERDLSKLRAAIETLSECAPIHFGSFSEEVILYMAKKASGTPPASPPPAALGPVEMFRQELIAALETSGNEPMKWLARELGSLGK
jgi:hypothetical protein